jgi:hypothetical protein
MKCKKRPFAERLLSSLLDLLGYLLRSWKLEPELEYNNQICMGGVEFGEITNRC